MRTVSRVARGFTLIEIMIVVMIIGIIASIAIPFYQKMGARAYRTEVNVILNKIRQHFITLYNDQGTFVANPGGVAMGVGAVSLWNPNGIPGPGGQWHSVAGDPKAVGWVDLPFPPEGNIKLRYQYSVDTTSQVTFYVCGTFPGFGAPIQPCGKNGDLLGNYTYQESLLTTTTTAVAEFPSPGF